MTGSLVTLYRATVGYQKVEMNADEMYRHNGPVQPFSGASAITTEGKYKPFTDVVCGTKVGANPKKSSTTQVLPIIFSTGCVTKFKADPQANCAVGWLAVLREVAPIARQSQPELNGHFRSKFLVGDAFRTALQFSGNRFNEGATFAVTHLETLHDSGRVGP